VDGTQSSGETSVPRRADGYSISSDPRLLDRDLIYRFLSTEAPWAEGIPRHLFDRSMDNSVCFGLHDVEGRTVGFARVITDHSTFAYIEDLFVLAEHRRRGLGGWLVKAIVEDRDLHEVKSWWTLADDPPSRLTVERAGFRAPEPERLRRWMAIPGRSRGYYLASEEPSPER